MESKAFHRFLTEMVTSSFFTNRCNFSKKEKEQKEDWIALTKGMLLLDVYSNAKWNCKDLSDESLIDYLRWAKEEYDDCQKNTIKSVIQYLEQVFPQKRGDVNKDTIPLLMCLAEQAMYEEIEPMVFGTWWDCFVRNRQF